MAREYISPTLRESVYRRANGQCEYCLIPEEVTFASHEIDHVIAIKHGGMTTQENLALSCSVCNKRKGTDLTSIDPFNNEIAPIFNPRNTQWLEHFQLQGGEIIALTPTGRATVRLLQLNRSERVLERNLLLEAGKITIPE